MILDNHMGLGSGGFCVSRMAIGSIALAWFSLSLRASEVIKLRGPSPWIFILPQPMLLFVTFYADVTEGRYGMLEQFFPTSHCLCMYEQTSI